MMPIIVKVDETSGVQGKTKKPTRTSNTKVKYRVYTKNK